MSFSFKPGNNTPVEFRPRKVPVLGSFSWMLVCVVLAGVGGAVAWSPAKRAILDAWARSHAREAIESMEADDMGHAIAELIEARKISPDEPEVIRAIIAYLKRVKGDRRELAYHLRLLATKEPLGVEDQLTYAGCLLEMGQTEEARRVFEKLPSSETDSAPALSFLGTLQAAEGKGRAARESGRKARQLDKNAPESRLEAAIENCHSIFPELRQQAWRELWDLCQLPPPVGLAAARVLLSDERLTPQDAQRLLPLVEAHPHSDLTIRLAVVSALIRFFPEKREDLINSELKRFDEEKKGTLVEMAAWLSEIGEHARLIAIMPKNLAATSAPLYTAIVKALVSLERWQDIKTMIEERRPPVSNTLATLWLADAESHLQPDLDDSRRLISFAIQSATNKGENAELEQAAAFAARLGMNDLSLRAYEGLLKALPFRKNEFLIKIRQLAFLTSNPSVLIDATRQLKDLNPENQMFADEHAYFRLLFGQDLETVDLAGLKRHTDTLSGTSSSEQRIPISLLEAMAAFRFNDKNAFEKHVARLPRVEPGMTAGQRAVMSGLLAAAGKLAEAFQIAEKVPDALLLHEELAFLKLAR